MNTHTTATPPPAMPSPARLGAPRRTRPPAHTLARFARASFVAAWCTAMVLMPRVHGAAGDLDPTFDGDGKVITDLSPGFDGASAVAVQDDGKVVVVGDTGGPTDLALARYDGSGVLDPTFGTLGIVTSSAWGGLGIAMDLAIQGDGKILVVGRAGGLGSGADFGMARFDANGVLDPLFGTGGIVITDLSGSFDSARSVAVQADGRIVVVGRAGGLGAASNFAVVRYEPNGDLDLSFGAGGIVLTDFAGDEDQASSVVIRPGDGALMVAGTVRLGGTGDFAVAVYDTQGNLDPAFGGGAGFVATDFWGEDDLVSSMALQADGSIVLVGRAGSAGPGADFGIVRYLPDGTLDPAFDGDGRAATDVLGLGLGEIVNDVAIQPDGGIVAVGTVDAGSSLDFAVVRYLPNGGLDPVFGSGGTVLTDLLGSGFNDGAAGVALQDDCRILACGFAGNGIATDLALTRYDGGTCTPFLCPISQGHWKTHPAGWPVDGLVLGAEPYSADELLAILGSATQSDASLILARQLIAAKLNLAAGSDPGPVDMVITDGDALLSAYPGKLPYKVKTSSPMGKAMTADAGVLNQYNNGLLTPSCAP